MPVIRKVKRDRESATDAVDTSCQLAIRVHSEPSLIDLCQLSHSVDNEKESRQRRRAKKIICISWNSVDIRRHERRGKKQMMEDLSSISRISPNRCDYFDFYERVPIWWFHWKSKWAKAKGKEIRWNPFGCWNRTHARKNKSFDERLWFTARYCVALFWNVIIRWISWKRKEAKVKTIKGMKNYLHADVFFSLRISQHGERLGSASHCCVGFYS